MIQAFELAIQLNKRIKDEQDREKEIDKLIERTQETTGEYQKFVKIQLGEGYVYTPQPEVRLDKWLEFLDQEKKFIADHVAELTKQFEEL